MKSKHRLLAIVLCLFILAFDVVSLVACVGDDICVHHWSDWSTTENATCTEAGAQERSCSDCGETETSTVDALGHDWLKATCTSPKTCKNCSATEGSVLAHAYTVETIKDEALKSAATCTSSAVYYKSCSCGLVSTNDADTFMNGFAIKHVDGDDRDHLCDYGCGKIADEGCYDTVKDGKCDECDADFDHVCADENKDHACDYGCAKTFGEHSDSDTDTDHVCDYGCQEVLENCSDAENDGDHNCDVCNAVDVTIHQYGNATCGMPATCSECNATTGSNLEHQDANRDHTCDNGCNKNDMGIHADSASDTDHVCDYGCGKVLENCSDVTTDNDHNCDVCGKENVTSHSHVENTALATEATCGEAATKTYVCNCGDSYTETVGDALGHNTTGVTPTERLVGGCEYVLVYICQNHGCGAEVLGETVYHHNHVASIKTPATCKNNGEKTFKCSICGDTSKASEIIPADATGHNWDTTANVVDGIRIDTCTVCGETKTVTVYTGTKTDKINAEDLANKEIELNDANISLDSGVIDTIGNQNVTVSADKVVGDDRTNLGLSEDQLAQVGDSPIYNFTINNGTENISDFHGNWVTITLPYELSEGEDVDSIAVWFINDEGELESIQATYNNGHVTFKTNHFSYYTVTRLTPAERCELYGHGYVCQHVEGNCMKDEYDLYVCIRCHDKYIDEATLKVADGHDYTADTHAATCTESGYVLYTCNDCGHSYRTKLGAIGHDWKAADSAEATCTSDGYVKYACTHCKEEYTVTEAKLSHVYTNTVVDATCTASGYTLHDCDNCDYSYTDTYVDALGHSYRPSVWTWSKNYNSATLTMVCEHNEEHTFELKAKVKHDVVNGNCSNFKKTTYTATVPYEGVEYSDQKIVETGTPDHSFSSDWSKNELAHWHECKCGEKSDVSDHIFENATITKSPTCSKTGESTSYCVCGATKVTVIPATGEHNFQNGVCTGCGANFTDAYYVNLVSSWKNVNGFSVKIQDLSFEITRQDSDLVKEFQTIGSIRQIDVAELALFVENGELGGAATGSFVIFNGPIANADTVCDFRAVIHEGYVYIRVDYGKDKADKTMNVKISVDALIEELLAEMDIEGDNLSALGFLADTVLPALDTLMQVNSDEANELLEDVFNMIFTFEVQEDGSYLATLDYAKLYALNENLAAKPISEVVDIYFGEGTFDAVTDWILEVLDLRVSEVPAYLDELGLDSAALMEKINEFAIMMGASEDFDVAELIHDKEFEKVTLGMLLFDIDNHSYVSTYKKAIERLQDTSLYELIDSGSSEEIKDTIDSILDLCSDTVILSFTTNASGELTAIHVSANEFECAYGREEIKLSFRLDLVVGGTIEITWSDIIEEIENEIVLPAPESLKEEIRTYYDYGYSGSVVYRGKKYRYYDAIRFTAYKTNYDRLTYMMFYPDCGGWIHYEACYPTSVNYFTLATIDVDGKNVYLMIDPYSNEVVELIENENGFTAIFEDGTQKEILCGSADDAKDIAKYFAELYFAIFEDSENNRENAFGAYVDYYYHPETKKYADESQHEYEYEYEFVGDSCEDGCIIHTTCKNCDYYMAEERFWCNTEDTEIDLSEYGACGGTIWAERCKICGRIAYIEDMNFQCKFDKGTEEEITDEEGNVIGYRYTQTCVRCGLSMVSSNWRERTSSCEYIEYRSTAVYYGEECIVEHLDSWYGEDHQYEYSYEFDGNTCEDGYYVNRYCSACGETNRSRGWGHNHEYREVFLGEYGLCGGWIEENYCSICDTVLYSYVRDYDCNWRFVEENSEGYSVYECRYCGTTKLSGYHIGEKDEHCQYTVTETRIYLVNGEEVYRYERSYRETSHHYDREFLMNGDSCTDGYTLISTCIDCGERYEDYYSSHNTFTFFELDAKYHGCCENHYLQVWGCPCGQEFSIDFSRYSFEFDEESQAYVCGDCGLSVSDIKNEVEDGCSVTVTTEFTVVLNGEELYSLEKEEICSNHSFTDVEISTVDGTTTIIASCDKCDAVTTTEILSAELEAHNGNQNYDEFPEYDAPIYDSDVEIALPDSDDHIEWQNNYDYDYDYGYEEEYDRQYYYDYTFTPDVSGDYTILGLSDGDTYVELYETVSGRLVKISSNDDGGYNTQFRLTAKLTAGTTYVYRIGFLGFNEPGTVTFAFSQSASEETVCHHTSYRDFSVLLNGSESCEDGVLCGGICTECGTIHSAYTEYWHNSIVKDRIELSEYGACYGEFISESCACGQEHRVEMDYSCAYTWTENKYYDDEGRLVYETVRTCPNCDLRYSRSYYTVKDRANCTLTYYYTVTINVGSTLVTETEYTVVSPDHDCEITGTLMNGEGASCEDGVMITYQCKNCDYEETYEYHHHETFEKEHVDLSALGNVCGGYVSVYGCACGEETYLSMDHVLCDLGSERCELWIEDALTEGQYTIDGWNSFGSSSYLYICAVTDPEACAYKIRYAEYWLKDENSCMAYRYETWQFGYDEETGTYQYEITFKTGRQRIYHNYVDNSTEDDTRYDCPDCGSYYYEKYTYDENGYTTKYEKIASNTLDNGYDKYSEEVTEYARDANGNRYRSREYYKRIYSDDREYWYENLRNEQAYVGPFGDNGRKIFVSSSNSYGNCSEEEYAYVWYMGDQYRIYTYEKDGDFWCRYDYTYSFEGECIRTAAYTNSNGESWTESENWCMNVQHEIIQQPTCSQDGEACNICQVCGKQSDSYVLSATDHNWVSISENWHYCFSCGLENENGVSGDIIMEDLTEDYGNGEYYVVGYYAESYVEFSHYVSLILADETEIAIWSGIEFITIDGIRAFAFSKAAVDAWAAEHGYADYDVRFSFVPVGSDGSFDYGITFAESEVPTNTIVDHVSFTDYVAANETKIYTITPTEDSSWTFTSFTDRDSYATLYDANGNHLTSNDDGGEGLNFRITYQLKAGETYTIHIRWLNNTVEGTMALLFGPTTVIA